MKRYLRNKNDGTIYGWDKILEQNPLCEEVSEEEAYPERFVKKEVVKQVKKKRKKAKSKLSLKTKNVPEAPPVTPEELGIEASRDLP